MGISSQSNAVCLCWLSRKDVFLSKGGGWRTLGSIFQGLCLHQSTSSDGCFSSSLGLILSFQPFSQVRDINSQTCSLPGFQVAPGSTRILGLVSGRFLSLFSDLLIRVKNVICQPGPLWLLTGTDQQSKTSYRVVRFNWEMRCFAVKSQDCSF